MKCPKCESDSLQLDQVKDVEVDRCPTCKGIWFDDQELPRILKIERRELRKLEGGKLDEALNRKRAKCPRDGKELLRVYSPQNESVVVDTCLQCSGIWLDGGELSQLHKG